jgi:uncharacterized phiE125 gp8 family phage protein
MPNPHYGWPEHILTRTSDPDPFVTVAECKAHSDIPYSDDDTIIGEYLAAAIAALDAPNGMVGKAIATQRWTWKLEKQTGKTALHVPIVPFRDVVSIKYYDADNVQQTETLTDYTYFGNEDFGHIEPKGTWPIMYDRPDALEIVFEAGFGDPADCPANLKQACKMLVAHWYENREAVSDVFMQEVPFSVQSMVGLSRIGWVK